MICQGAKFDNTILNAGAILTQQEAYRFFTAPLWHLEKQFYILERMRE